MGDGNPLPYPEFAGPYQEFIGALCGGSEELTTEWGGVGDGQGGPVKPGCGPAAGDLGCCQRVDGDE
ncbi:hypothetical protein Aros01_04976 [Streptosporangium roseum]|uniref:Uncharacterized protein n=1 Tax=Streptosporangium roseum (strain ATCC 12428 / DSM 43021 / JCM 3005 / KCTC 9067 / NCIMB 10171 / NRRL 2505 / NI 9100) TaxID=479432 RepID=D2AUJ7_STRRD|nr:hypothetical protein Sros_1871 [Streptosporangium roseum DSM 43021]